MLHNWHSNDGARRLPPPLCCTSKRRRAEFRKRNLWMRAEEFGLFRTGAKSNLIPPGTAQVLSGDRRQVASGGPLRV